MMNEQDNLNGNQQNPADETSSQNYNTENTASGSSESNQNFNDWQRYPGNGQGASSEKASQSGQNGSGFQQFQQAPNQQQNADYQWTMEDYKQVSGNAAAEVKPKKNKGLMIFAIVISVVFVLTAIAFGSVIVYLMQKNSGVPDSTVSAETSEPIRTGPTLSLENRPAPEEEEYKEGVLSTEEIAAQVRPSVVGIVSYQNTTFPMQSYSTGSGIVMTSDGYIITNAHVVSGARGIVVVLADESEYEAELIGIDEKTDLAVVKIKADNLTPAEFGNSNELVVGERIVAIGNPTGLNLAGSVTQGIVSGLERSIQLNDESTGAVIQMQVIQVDAAINPGNSGGALINKYGQVVGINSSKLSSTQIEGIGFAIPISTAKPIVDDLIEYGYVRGRVLLGITYVGVSDVMGAMSGYTPGLWIQSVREDLDVYAKGIRPGDVIVKIDDQDVRDSDTVAAIMKQKKPGETVKLEIVRAGVTGKMSTFTVDVELSEDTGSYHPNQNQQRLPNPGEVRRP